MLSKKPRNPGKLGIIPGFPRFFAHRGKPGKRGAFLPGFPGFPRLLEVTFLASQETVESWKARKVRSLLAFHAFQDFLPSQESPRFPGKPRDSWLSWLFLMCKKAWKARNFSAEFRGFLGSFLQGLIARLYIYTCRLRNTSPELQMYIKRTLS